MIFNCFTLTFNSSLWAWEVNRELIVKFSSDDFSVKFEEKISNENYFTNMPWMILLYRPFDSPILSYQLR